MKDKEGKQELSQEQIKKYRDLAREIEGEDWLKKHPNFPYKEPKKKKRFFKSAEEKWSSGNEAVARTFGALSLFLFLLSGDAWYLFPFLLTLYFYLFNYFSD